MKMNSLVDRRCIRALYRASQAGVPVDLNIRGICCLVPGVEGVSENIRVNSVVGRFLEHSRIFAFERDGETTVLIGSADLMPRNLDTRVELVAPVEDPALKEDLLDTLERSLADETNAWDLRPGQRLGAARARRARAAQRPARADDRPRGARRRGRPAGLTAAGREYAGAGGGRSPTAVLAGRRDRRHPHPRADARQPAPRAAARRGQRRPAGQGVVVHGRRQRRAPGADRPLVGPHPDRHEHRAAPRRGCCSAAASCPPSSPTTG